MLHKYACRLYRWWRFSVYLYFEYILYSTKYSFDIYNKKRAAASVWGNLFRKRSSFAYFSINRIINSIYVQTTRTQPPTLITRLFNFIQKYTTIHIQKKKKNLDPETAARRGYRSFFFLFLNDRYRLMPRVDSARWAYAALIFEIQIQIRRLSHRFRSRKKFDISGLIRKKNSILNELRASSDFMI